MRSAFLFAASLLKILLEIILKLEHKVAAFSRCAKFREEVYFEIKIAA